MNTKHPDTDRLNDYLQQPEARDHAELRLHLAQCADCRSQLELLNSLHQQYPLPQPPIDERQQQQVADYIDSPEADSAQAQRIKNNPALLKAALHYASHRAAMDEELKPEFQQPSLPAAPSAIAALRAGLLSILQYRSPLWLNASLGVAMLLVISLLILPLMPSLQQATGNGLQIAQYRDNPLIQFRPRQALPGIGFFSKTEEENRPYGELRISFPQPHIIRLQWPAVKNAKIYSLRLQKITQGKKITLADIRTELNRADIKLDTENLNHRYEWTLTGTTSNNKQFIARGGFVINQLSSGLSPL